jgi:hypothetical protein
MGWRTTIAKGAIKRCVPFMPQLRRLKRQISGFSPNIANLDGTLIDAQRLLKAHEAAGGRLDGSRVLEIGSGWMPLIPLLLRLKGAREVILTDIEPFMDQVSFEAGRDYLLQRLATIAPMFGLDESIARKQLESFTSIEAAQLRYLVPFTPAMLGTDLVDFVYSRTVLEHIPPAVLVSLLEELRARLTPAALMVHLVDESDHLEHQDKSISRVNFLTLTDRQWSIANACYDYQNRLRHHEFTPLFSRAGLDVVAEEAWVDPRVMAVLPTLKLQPPFDSMTPEQIAVMWSVFTLRPRALQSIS